jgi:hypothetical protein
VTALKNRPNIAQPISEVVVGTVISYKELQTLTLTCLPAYLHIPELTAVSPSAKPAEVSSSSSTAAA